jgi:hypothetical protein
MPFSILIVVLLVPAALIFTIQGWQKSNWKKIKIALALYFLQLLSVTVLFGYDPLPVLLFFVLIGGGPYFLCAIALARAKKNLALHIILIAVPLALEAAFVLRFQL